MKSIPLTQGQVAWVSDRDYARVRVYKWQAHKDPRNWYAVRSSGRPKRTRIMLHRFILDAPTGIEVDHRDGNGLNCQRRNLRLATHLQNTSNRKLHSNNTSGYKGVSRKGDKWVAQICVNRKVMYLGSFSTPELASKKYNREAKRRFGSFYRKE